jgi:hypothetical protein
LAADDLCTLADVKLELRKTDSTDDTLLSALITDASTTIQTKYGRFIADTTTRVFPYRGQNRLDLFPYFLRTPSAVTSTVGTASTTLTATTDYSTRPLHSTVYRYLYLPTTSLGTSETTISITGTWGFSTIPNDVKRAAVITVADWYRAGGAYTTVLDTDEAYQGGSHGDIPRGAKKLLEPYQRYGQG